MKLLSTIALTLLFHCTSNATIHIVTVASNTFSPSTFNAVIGDVIQFNWASGFHTTTCGSLLPGTSLPPGAAEWNSDMTSTTSSFSYTVTVAGDYLYGCQPHFAFGMEGRFTVSGTLPIAFGSFNVINDNNKALMKWKTFSESNTDYFSIRKSTDANHFYEIGRLNAAGNSNHEMAYQFADADLGNTYKYLYYEIVTVDFDKKESFSTIKTLRNNGLTRDNLIVSLSPNPISRPGQVQLKFNADKAGELNVLVFNSSGQLVLKTKMAAFYGLNSGHLHVCDLNKGTYNVVFQLAGKKETKKIVVL
ncbi:MAG: T9SS type A sorting domain-containing protein [Ferruginibacter sp.]